jgi:hypothetical protein
MKLHLIGGGALAALLSACGSSPVYDPYDWRVTWIEVSPAANRLADADHVTLRAPSARYEAREGG